MPRLTTAPSGMSTATRAAIWSRVQAGVVFCSLMTLSLILFETSRAGGAARHFYDVLDEQARRDDGFGVDLAQLDDLVHRCDGALGGGGHDGAEVAGCFAVQEVAPAVAGFGLDKGEVGEDGVLEHVVAAVDLAHFFALGQFGAVAGRGEEGAYARAGGADALGQVALRHKLEFDLAGMVE